MAIFYVLVDDQGNLLRIEQRPDDTIIRKLLNAYNANRTFQQGVYFSPAPDYTYYQLNALRFDLDHYSKMTPEQRAKAEEQFQAIRPGDAIHYINARVFFQQGGDVPARPKPLFTVFIDP